jgi:hypothetical protein
MARRPTARDMERVATARPPRLRRRPRRLRGMRSACLQAEVSFRPLPVPIFLSLPTSTLKRPTPRPNEPGTGFGGDLDLVAPMTNNGRGLAERRLAQHPQLLSSKEPPCEVNHAV